MSVSNHLTPRNNSEGGRIQFNRGGRLRSTCRSCQRHMSPSLQDLLSIGRYLLGASLITSLKHKLCTDVRAHRILQKINALSNTHKTQLHFIQMCLTGTHRLLVTGKWCSAFPSANHCQGQLRITQSLCIFRKPQSTRHHSRFSFVRPWVQMSAPWSRIIILLCPTGRTGSHIAQQVQWLGYGSTWLNSRQKQGTLYTKRPDRLCGPPILLPNG